jgi:transcription elongation factor/antiterminator RfaH
MEYWYALNTKPHQERRLAEQLRQRRLAVYLPEVRVNPVNPRAALERPLFPGYLFAWLDLQAAGLGALQWTPGLRGVVQFGGLPATVPDDFIGRLRRRLARVNEMGGMLFDGLQPGDGVRITSGPFEGYDAVFDRRLSGRDRVLVLLEIVQQAQRRSGSSPEASVRRIPVELSAGSIEKLKKTEPLLLER